MSLQIGIVGLPNVGKSTLFNALVKARQAQASNFAFCTIDPNVGIVNVPDPRLQQLYKIVVANLKSQNANNKQILNSNRDENVISIDTEQSRSGVEKSNTNRSLDFARDDKHKRLLKIIPATVEFIDIAGLVKEAHKGEGLGNKFLSHIRNTDAICMVLRCFEDSNITHVSGKIDPKDDFETIKTELKLADLSTEEKLNSKSKGKSPFAKASGDDQAIKWLSRKPMIFVANVSEKEASLSPEEIVQKYKLKSEILNLKSLVVISAKVEQDLIDLDEKEQQEYLETLGLKQSGLDRLIKTAYHTLGLITFYTTKGGKELSAWAIKKGTKAPQAAGKIHTDFERGFIKAEVITYDDYIKYNGEQKARETGKLRQEGKDYIVKNGDVIEFKFNI